MNKLVVDHISKKIKGKIILNDISVSMDGGKVYGLVGRNGSGKTMFLRAVAGLMRVDGGSISFDGKVLHRDFPVYPSLGLIIENAGLYPELTGLENLWQLAKIKKLITKDEAAAALERVGLDPCDKRTVGKYSLGMKQRLIVAQAVMERPEVLLLDEPTNALDAEGLELVRGIIQEEKARGALVILASHNKDDIYQLSDEVYHIEAGVLGKAGN